MARRINQNQYRKIYPGIRKKPDMITVGGLGVDIEIAILSFNGESSATYTFTNRYDTYPTVHATAGTGAGLSGNVNLYVSSIDTTSVTISSSAPFKGTAHLVVVERS